MESSPYLVTRQRLVQAPPGAIFELLADPCRHPLIDGSGTVKRARYEAPQRLGLGAEFGMDMHLGPPYRNRNTVVEFEEARLIAWRQVNGHRWRYELIPAPRGTLVRETWDASRLKRQWPLKAWGITRSRQVNLERSLDRLADYFDPETPTPADPVPPSPPKRATKRGPESPAEAAKRAARGERATRAEEATLELKAAKSERAARAREAKAIKRAETAEQTGQAREAKAAAKAAAAERAAQAEQAKADEKAAATVEAVRAQEAKEAERAAAAERAAQAEQAKADKKAAAAVEAERAQEARETQKAEVTAETARAREAKAARRAAAAKARPVKASKPAREATAQPHADEAVVEPVPPIGATARRLDAVPRRPSRVAIAAAKAGRPVNVAQDHAAGQEPPAVGAPAPEASDEDASGNGRPPGPARRMRRAG